MLLTVLYILLGSAIIGSILCSALNNAMFESALNIAMLESANEIKCNTPCPYGFEPDIEGVPTCRCRNPCAGTMCFDGTECVAKMPRNCEWEPCKPQTFCREVPRKASKTTVNDRRYMSTKWKDPYYITYQRDAPYLTSDSDDVCSQLLPQTAVTCRRKHRRWYYNPMTGQCIRFLGCDTNGNNFSRKRYCKSKCRRHIHPAKLRQLQTDEHLCSMPRPKDVSCEEVHRRWYFNASIGKCEKFNGCPSFGNNFSRKIFCKATCKNKSKKYNRLYEIGSDSKEQPPR